MPNPPDIRLLLAVLAPLAGAGLVMLTGRKPNLRETCPFVAAATLFLIVASMIPCVRAGHTLHFTLFQLLPPTATSAGLSFSLRADALSMIFAVTASFLWVVAVFYSAGYMRSLHEHAQTRFNTCFALAIFGAIGCAFADNLLTLYLFYEIVSITTYPLVAHHQDEEGYEGAKKYLVYLTTAAKGLVLPAMVLIYVLSGTLDFATNAHTGILPANVHNGVIVVLYICCILGFAKNGVMPLHNWLPSAMVAPTPVSALLHAVAVVKVGVFSTVRVMLYVFGVDLMDRLHLGLPTAYFVSITILVGSIVALSKDNLKARLAYSTVSQLSYIILGVALLTPRMM
jgi:multicomponent Na+:H+ antiporter subunit D